MVFSREGSFTCHTYCVTYCDTGHPFLRSYIQKTHDSHFKCRALAKEQSLLGFDAAGSSGAQIDDLQITRQELYHSEFSWSLTELMRESVENNKLTCFHIQSIYGYTVRVFKHPHSILRILPCWYILMVHSIFKIGHHLLH
jgi:hypothetical protein